MSSLKSSIEKGLRGSAFFLAILSALALTAILLVIITSVVLRKFFDSPLFFAEELVGLLMSASLFLALPMATIKGQHIRVTLLIEALKDGFALATKILVFAGTLVGIAFTGWILWEAIPWMEFAIRRELKSETARILLYPLMSVVPVSMGLCLLIYCARVVGIVKLEER
ncbi:TRAP transporter small permease [Vibrio sp. SCSIO 43136]|uniref:TRAP transporter small permease n=1 Tax=Vibrio sp. SCSIO 43136 TaxID=2819101 RepID=UPI00207536DB|nr:TRAP transporter small permease [Vibrio sp. SCSIO 43136]USD64303.1 TRAP transporter small permease [Vibrio sp. SCSIO 43136]